MVHPLSSQKQLGVSVAYFGFPYSSVGRVCLRHRSLHAMLEIQVRFLGWEDPLEKEMATHSSVLAWEIPWTEEPAGLDSMESQESDMT